MRAPGALIAIALGASAAAADGLSVTLATGGGYYWQRSSYPSAVEPSELAVPVGVWIGTAIRPDVTLGGAAIIDVAVTDEYDFGDGPFDPDGVPTIFAVGAFADYYVGAASTGPYVQVFAGWGGLERIGAADDDTSGFAMMLGVGYDKPVSPRLRAGGLLRFTLGRFQCCSDPEITRMTYAPALLATLTWH